MLWRLGFIVFQLGSMVINNFNGVRLAFFPGKADAPLIVNAYAVLPCPIAFQGFQAIAGRHPHIIQGFSAMKLQQLAERSALDVRGQPARSLAFPNLFRLFIAETLNHFSKLITLCVMAQASFCFSLRWR